MAGRCEQCGRFTNDPDAFGGFLCPRCGGEPATVRPTVVPQVVPPGRVVREPVPERVPQISTGLGCGLYVVMFGFGLWALVNVLGVEQTHGWVTAAVATVLFGWPLVVLPALSPRLARWIPALGNHDPEDDLGWDFGCGLLAVAGMVGVGLVVIVALVFAIPVVLGVLLIIGLGWGVIIGGVARRL